MRAGWYINVWKAQMEYIQFSADFRATMKQFTVVAILGLAALASAAPQFPQQRPIAILRQAQDQDPAGSWTYSFETENGISASQSAALKYAGSPQQEVQAVQGQYSYTGPDGIQYTVQYTADENGFQAYGAHLPTPPPIPAEIQRSIEFNARNPEPGQLQQGQAQGQVFRQTYSPAAQTYTRSLPAGRPITLIG